MTKQSRIFCSTGEGGGTDPSCSPKDAGGGGDKKFPGESGPGAKEKAKKVFEQQKDRADAKKYGDLPSSWTRISGNTGDGTAAASYGSAKSKNTHGATVYQYGDKWIAEFGKQSPADGRIKAKGRQTKIQPSRTEAIKWADKKAKDAGLVPSKAAAAKQAAGSGKKSPARPKVVDDISMFPGEAKYAGNMKAQLDAKKKKGRSTAPAAESRLLAVERRSLVLDNGADGQQTLCVESRCEHREEDGTETKRDYIVGYAAKFGVTSLDLGKFTERIAPSAFGLVSERRGRRKTLETRALFNHNADMPLAKYPGTLKLSVDDVGLRYEFPVPDTSYGRDLAANIRDGIVTGSSFSFTVPKDGESWSVEDGKSVRTVTRVDSLIDVGPVTYPAYPDTDARVAKRSYDHFRKSNEARTARRQRLKLVASRAAAEIKRFLAKHGR
jgi:HK97 family phage prohead protease